MRAPPSPRRGYAMLLAIVFVILMLALLGAAYRQLGATLLIESARAQQVVRDEGRLRAAAVALALLETGLPPTDPYVRLVQVNTSQGPGNFLVTIASEGSGLYSVQATATGANDPTPPIDATFGMVPPP